MKRQGTPKRLTDETSRDFREIPLSLFTSSTKYPIRDYARLFSNDNKISSVKRALAEGKPVVIGMTCFPSFSGARGVWVPNSQNEESRGGHAMCVVGYDDDMYGGAFEIQNSWGTWWGNEGYIWVRYTDFQNYVWEAYELIEDLMAYQNVAEFSGAVEIEVKGSSRGMEVEFVNEGYYRTKTSYPSGTDFRYLMNCDKPAYLYAFTATDAANSYYRLFPADGVLAVLDYRQNSFYFPPERPGEIDWMFLDGPPGTEYLVVLFSKQPLDIDAIGRRFMNARGNFAQKIESAVGSNYIRPHTARYERNRIAYTAQSSSEKAVFGLLLEINHR
jgi:hypothetical protein